MAVRVHKQHGRRALWQRRWSELRKRSIGEFVAIPTGATFLEDADFVSMDFYVGGYDKRAMLPNDAQILCAARRVHRSQFGCPSSFLLIIEIWSGFVASAGDRGWWLCRVAFDARSTGKRLEK